MVLRHFRHYKNMCKDDVHVRIVGHDIVLSLRTLRQARLRASFFDVSVSVCAFLFFKPIYLYIIIYRPSIDHPSLPPSLMYSAHQIINRCT